MPVDRYRANKMRDRVSHERSMDSLASFTSACLSREAENTTQQDQVRSLVERLTRAHEKEPERWAKSLSLWKQTLTFLGGNVQRTLGGGQMHKIARMHALLTQYEAGTLAPFDPAKHHPRRVIPPGRPRPPLAPFLSDAKLLPKKPPSRST